MRKQEKEGMRIMDRLEEISDVELLREVPMTISQAESAMTLYSLEIELADNAIAVERADILKSKKEIKKWERWRSDKTETLNNILNCYMIDLK